MKIFSLITIGKMSVVLLPACNENNVAHTETSLLLAIESLPDVYDPWSRKDS